MRSEVRQLRPMKSRRIGDGRNQRDLRDAPSVACARKRPRLPARYLSLPATITLDRWGKWSRCNLLHDCPVETRPYHGRHCGPALAERANQHDRIGRLASDNDLADMLHCSTQMAQIIQILVCNLSENFVVDAAMRGPHPRVLRGIFRHVFLRAHSDRREPAAATILNSALRWISYCNKNIRNQQLFRVRILASLLNSVQRIVDLPRD